MRASVRQVSSNDLAPAPRLRSGFLSAGELDLASGLGLWPFPNVPCHAIIIISSSSSTITIIVIIGLWQPRRKKDASFPLPFFFFSFSSPGPPAAFVTMDGSSEV